MRGVAQQTNATVPRRAAVAGYPVGERVAVDKLPVNEFGFRSLGHDAPAHGVPAVEHLFDVGEVPGERP
jgi:hypothetical protein